jgi:cation diffusion facilitator family transporter
MKPADELHHYGHGKIENLSALFETILLLATCGWIVYESIVRLFFKHIAVDPSIWAFGIMATSIVVDYSRSRILFRTARKYKSQALEADALHFRTDIWSSAVVIFGLLGVAAARLNSGLQVLNDADAIAAVLVAVIVVYVSVRLGARTIYALMDSAPEGLREQIRRTVEEVPGIQAEPE